MLSRAHYEVIARNRAYFGEIDPFGDFDLIFGAAKYNLKMVDLPIRYAERVYGDTNIQRWKSGMILLRMVLLAMRRIKFISDADSAVPGMTVATFDSHDHVFFFSTTTAPAAKFRPAKQGRPITESRGWSGRSPAMAILGLLQLLIVATPVTEWWTRALAGDWRDPREIRWWCSATRCKAMA